MTDGDNLNRFISMAQAGVAATADDAEHAAYQLAQAAFDDAPELAPGALCGFAKFTALSHYKPGEMRSKLDRE